MEEIIFDFNKKIPDEEAINIIFAGDFCLDGRIENLCVENKCQEIYGDYINILKDKDLSIVNLECPLTDSKESIKKIGPVLSAKSETVKALKYASFDVVALANNHILDKGEKGLADTLKICGQHDIKTVGAGKNLQEALKPLYVEIKDIKLAILNFAESEFSVAGKNSYGVAPVDCVLNYYAIKEARKNSDFVLVIVHGGNEYYSLPNPEMQKRCRFLVDVGAAVVLCHHTHCSSGYETYKGKPIFYGLGNFIFDRPKAKIKSWFESYFIQLRVYKNKVIRAGIIPYVQGSEEPGLFLLNGNDRKEFMENFHKICEIINNENELVKSWKSFCCLKKRDYLYSIFKPNIIKRFLMKLGLFRKYFLSKKRRLRLMLNLFRCDSHREAIISVLEDELSGE